MKFRDIQFDDVNLTLDQKIKVQLVASLILEAFDGGDWPLARSHWQESIKDMDSDEQAACWQYFDSKQRAYLNDRGDRKYLQEPT